MVGVPAGEDSILWNAHRVYGDVRWPLLTMNWAMIGDTDYDIGTDHNIKFFRKVVLQSNANAPSRMLRNQNLPVDASSDSESSIPKWLRNYKEYHADQLRNHLDTARFLVYSCSEGDSCGGIGDRLRGIITCFYLAVATDRVFLIHNPSPIDLGIMFDTSMIDWKTYAGYAMERGPLSIWLVDQMSDRLFSDFTGHQYVNIRTNMMQWREILSHREFESSLKAKGIPFA